VIKQTSAVNIEKISRQAYKIKVQMFSLSTLSFFVKATGMLHETKIKIQLINQISLINKNKNKNN